ncbi:unnamed protein product [Sphagnum balticum]
MRGGEAARLGSFTSAFNCGVRGRRVPHLYCTPQCQSASDLTLSNPGPWYQEYQYLCNLIRQSGDCDPWHASSAKCLGEVQGGLRSFAIPCLLAVLVRPILFSTVVVVNSCFPIITSPAPL